MLDAHLYHGAYLIVVTIFSVIIATRPSLHVKNDKFLAWGVMFLMILFIGFRPENGVFVDMMNYVQSYYVFVDGISFRWDSQAENFLFDNYFAFVGSQKLGTTFFFVTIAAIYFGCAYWGISRLFPKNTLMAYLAFLGAFSTFSYGTNGVKAGAAASMFILALSYYDNKVICMLLMLVTLGFHHSMTMPIAAFVLALLWKNPKHFFWGWLFCLACALAHISFFQQLFAGFTDEHGAGYLNSINTDWGEKSGLRIDFVLYSAMPVLVGYYAIYKKKLQSKTYAILLKIYLTTNGVWMLCMYAAFTNRIAYLSWSIYPLVLIYPLLEADWGVRHYVTVARVFMAHLAFTLFMVFVYY